MQNQYLQNQVLIIYRNFNRHTYSVMHQGHTTFTHFDDLQQLGKLPSHVSLHNQVVSNNSRHKKNKPLSVYASISQFCRKRHHGEYTRIAHEHNHHENIYPSMKYARYHHNHESRTCSMRMISKTKMKFYTRYNSHFYQTNIT